MKNNLKFSVSAHSSESEDLLTAVLVKRGVSDVNFFENLSRMDVNVPGLNPHSLFNMDRAISTVLDAISANLSIGILVDGDADGFSAASMLNMYLRKAYRDDKINILSLGYKSHGLDNSMEIIKNSGVDLILVPDAGSNDFDSQELLTATGTQVVIIDHHDIDEQSKAMSSDAIIVNNMMRMNADTNVNFVGAGMVLQFIKALDEKLQVGIDNELSLFALGQVADMSDISDYEIRHEVFVGYQQMKKHPLFSSVFTDFELDNMSAHKMAFELIPKINAVSRVGTVEERIDLVNVMSAIYDEDDLISVERRRKNKVSGKMEKVELQWSRYELAVDILKKIKARQDAVVKKNLGTLEYISQPSDGIMIAVMGDELPSALSGLIANKIISQYSMPAFVVRKNGNKYSGSMRCPGEFEFRTWLNETALASSQGHEQAAGVEFNADDLEALLEQTRTLDIAKDFYEVDKIYDEDTVSVNEVQMLNDNISLFGGRVSEARLGFSSIPIAKSSIKVRGSVITFSYKGLTFLMYNGTWFADWLMTTGFKKEFRFDIYGGPAENNWNNVITTQIIVDDIALSDKVPEKPVIEEDYDF